MIPSHTCPACGSSIACAGARTHPYRTLARASVARVSEWGPFWGCVGVFLGLVGNTLWLSHAVPTASAPVAPACRESVMVFPAEGPRPTWAAQFRCDEGASVQYDAHDLVAVTIGTVPTDYRSVTCRCPVVPATGGHP